MSKELTNLRKSNPSKMQKYVQNHPIESQRYINKTMKYSPNKSKINGIFNIIGTRRACNSKYYFCLRPRQYRRKCNLSNV